MKHLAEQAGLQDQFYIESAATSTEEIGNEVYPPAKRKLAEHGISCKGKTARQMTRSDYGRFDLLIGMDDWNIRNMMRICGGDPEGKIHKLMDYTRRPGVVEHPLQIGIDALVHLLPVGKRQQRRRAALGQGVVPVHQRQPPVVLIPGRTEKRKHG